MFNEIDVIQARRVPLIYVCPPFCEIEFSSSSEPVIILNPLPRRRGPTGLTLSNSGGVETLSWNTVDGAICYNVYVVVNPEDPNSSYVLVAECITDPSVVIDDPGTYVVTVITLDGESDPSDPITFEGPGIVCLLRIADYGSIAQPFFTPDPTSPASAEPEWDGIWNLFNTTFPGDTNDYWYSDVNGNFGPAPAGPGNPAISIQGRGNYFMLIRGPFAPTPDISDIWWQLLIESDFSVFAKKVWVAYKIGGDTSTPVGNYVNGEVSAPTVHPPGSFSDPRLSVDVEFCEF